MRMKELDFMQRLYGIKPLYDWYITSNGLILGKRGETVACPFTAMHEVVNKKILNRVDDDAVNIACAAIGLTDPKLKSRLNRAVSKSSGHDKFCRSQILYILGLLNEEQELEYKEELKKREEEKAKQLEESTKGVAREKRR